MCACVRYRQFQECYELLRDGQEKIGYRLQMFSLMTN